MKTILMTALFTLSFSVMANIDDDTMSKVTPKAERVEAARACFNELKIQGCGHPRDDIEQFRACLQSVYTNLDPSCKTIMKRLYGDK